MIRVSGAIRDLDACSAESSELAEYMPNMLAHEGRWEGDFQHFDNNGGLLETHRGVVSHEFPTKRKFAHIQNSHFSWDNGQEHILTQKSVFEDGKLWWESGPFQGCIWETEFGIILVNITQTSGPRLCLNEMMCLEPNGNRRSRVKQWFKHGKLFKRTLCHERRISN